MTGAILSLLASFHPRVDRAAMSALVDMPI